MSGESKRPPRSMRQLRRFTDNLNIQTAGPRGLTLLQDVWLIESRPILHAK